MKAKHKRLFFVSFGLALLGGAVALALVALQDTVTFFFTPSQAAERSIQPGQRVRLGGLVIASVKSARRREAELAQLEAESGRGDEG